MIVRAIAIGACLGLLLLRPHVVFAQILPSSSSKDLVSTVDIVNQSGVFRGATDALGAGSGDELLSSAQLYELLSDGPLLDVGALPSDSLLGLESTEQELLLLGAPSQSSRGDLLQSSSRLAVNPAMDNDRHWQVPVVSFTGICEDDNGEDSCDFQDMCAGPMAGALVFSEHCRLSPNIPLELVGVFFDFSGHRLRPESYLVLDRVVALLKQQPLVLVEVSGHTDIMGSSDFNKRLSARRAEAVYDYLISQGVEPYRLRYKGYGASYPVSENRASGRDYPDGRARNRRVELRVVGDLSDSPN